MKVLKFGGTSVGSPSRVKHVANLITNGEKKIVVLSAVSGTTNSLVALCEAYQKGDTAESEKIILQFREKYTGFINELYAGADEKYAKKASEKINEIIDLLASFSIEKFSNKTERIILAQGELMSTQLMQFYLESTGENSVLLPALEFMKTTEEEPDDEFIKENLQKQLTQYSDCPLFITQGYICKNEFGEIDNLKRGGSDYTASIIGKAAGSSEIQIWTDIDGMHNNDPRIVDKTFPVRELTFEEAAELAYFGAKILHPSSILPAQKANIPVKLLNTMEPEKEGTKISSEVKRERKIAAVAAKDGIVAIKIKSSRMLFAYGFLRKVFEVFEQFKTPIDVITTSEVAVSVTIDKTNHLEEILTELKIFGEVEFDQDHTIICVVGKFLQKDTRIAAQVISVLKDIPIRMISYGGSKNNITILIHKDYKVQALKALNEEIFLIEE
ncbi:aspartate kinase [Flexithrix dorotheae]|uniref:aspartate kinase n=1 Tax=Flexithrix dorotheae TaxID=70993 RepID=UPI000377DCB8|nr:aspartate kinase [Flexithrix dorotheae]